MNNLEINEDDIAARNAKTAKSLEKVLNLHGFSFQYALLQRAEEIRKSAKEIRGRYNAEWWLEATEIPVGSGVESTHIDFVMEVVDRHQSDDRCNYVIGEAKRVDPAKGSWCFAKSPYTFQIPDRTKDMTQFDRIESSDDSGKKESKNLIALSRRGVYDRGFEVKTNKTGDGVGSHYNSAIESAVTQVLKGTKGYINYLCGLVNEPDRPKLRPLTTFIPVIFTTAQLYTTDSDISAADLTNGHLLPDSITVKEADWIWFNHNRSVNLSHNVTVNEEFNSHFDRYFRDFSRSIAIVGPSGFNGFFSSGPHEWLNQL